MRFEGKTAVITGGSSGIGRGTVDLFLREGATVVMGDIDEAEGTAMMSALGDNFLFKTCDVTQEDQVKALMDHAAEKTGGIDIVFNNAGAGGPRDAIDEISGDDWDFAMALLLKSVAMGIRHAAPHLKKRGGGAIVNTASICSFQAGFGPIAYSTAKAGVLHLTKVAAAELAQYKIRVNAICPGFIQTNIFASTVGANKEETQEINSVLGQAAASAQPVGRPGVPSDIAEAAAYLASDAAGFVTGTHLLVDGGMLVGTEGSWNPEIPGMLDAILPEHLR
ncbi:SDR family NAD(P)-dependent oxidoreductase [Parasphingorhabdus sp.]|jgi:NAD(P)-dependent dehydrogenase (short-subunit alcohol dehydrogenase family)|uniref:SDR family NAD(P)-dependent oxidoreductase n=1 Tax=Parasphingorhabdus sp. TaxID=2709688 RepID=UPI0007F4EB06|nr:2,5-dichloro-2,5-cyclohexadiene-1,4-diol dehydrogenase [Sphingomonadales bacterium EhC05]